MARRAHMCTQLSQARLWALLFQLVVGVQPVAADLCCGEGGVSHGLALAGFRVKACDVVERPFFTRHPSVSFTSEDALKFDLGGCHAGFGSPPCQV